MKKIIIIFLALTLLSACAKQPNNSTSIESSISASDTNTSCQSDIDQRPLTKKIPIYSEGEEVWATANLITGGDGKYNIYAFDDPDQGVSYDFIAGKDGDMITRKNQTENPIYKNYIRIISSDGTSELPKDSKDKDGFTLEYSRIRSKRYILDIEMCYLLTPPPYTDTWLRSMLDTLVIK